VEKWRESMDKVEIIKVLKEIKAECSEHKHCCDCPLYVNGEWKMWCIIDASDLPEEWEIVTLNDN